MKFIGITKALAVSAVALASLNPAFGAVVFVGTEAGLGADDSIDWAQLGPTFTQINTPVNVLSANGATITVGDGVNPAERRDQGNGWAGSFAPGDALLWNSGSGSLTFTFANAVAGFGTQFQSDSYGAFTGTISVNGGALGVFNFGGVSGGAGDNSSPFAGVLSDAADITSVTYDLTSNGTSFAVNAGRLAGGVAGGVPEPSAWALLILGMGLTGAAMRRRQQAVRVRFA